MFAFAKINGFVLNAHVNFGIKMVSAEADAKNKERVWRPSFPHRSLVRKVDESQTPYTDEKSREQCYFSTFLPPMM